MERNSKDSARSSQAQLMQILQSMLDDQSKRRLPAIIPGCLYTRSDLVDGLGVSDHTVSRWVRDGLNAYKPQTKEQLFLADDVIEFVRSRPVE